MIILGITHPISENPAACVLRDGQLVAFAEEERFRRLKHAPHMHPAMAVDYCLRETGAGPGDLACTAVGFEKPMPGALDIGDAGAFLAGRLAEDEGFSFRVALDHLCMEGHIPPMGKMMYFDHHLAHAASAFVPSGQAEANIISVDGWGGELSGLLGYCDGTGDIRVLRPILPKNSWGMLFELVTYHLGFRPHSEEGKTMGLAAYGSFDEEVLPDFTDPELGLPDVARYRKHLAATCGAALPSGDFTQRHKNLAASLQYYYERSLARMARFLSAETGCGSFVVAGGVGLNCKANGILAELDCVKELFVQPASHDAGSALGAAILAHRALSGQWPEAVMPHAYWGPGYTEETIRSALEFAKADFRKVDPALEAASCLADNKLVGFFQGRSEVGPRALGNRSILAHPGHAENLDRVNAQVKRRELWRPFAPSVLENHAQEIFGKGLHSPFMLVASRVTDDWRGRVPAVVHVDGTCRPQVVQEKANPLYHRMISSFYERTGIPLVLNTSFNLSDEPIVNAPDQALATFFRSGLDVLIMGDHAVYKR